MTARFRLQPARPGDAPRAVFVRSVELRRASRFGSALLAYVALLCAPREVFADDLQQLELGKTRFDAGQYEEARGMFAAMLDPKATPCLPVAASAAERCRLTDPDIIERARTLYAAALVALKRDTEAEDEIATILRTNPNFSPDPAVLPQEVLDRFTLVRARLRAELEAEAERRAQEERKENEATEKAKQDERRWLEALKKAAGEQLVVVKHSRIMAAVPFGVGQFQNGSNTLGTIFAISQTTAALTTIVSGQLFTYYAGFNPTFATAAQRKELVQGQDISLMVNRIAFTTWAALSIAGIVQAQAAYVPDKLYVMKRPLPPAPKAPVSFVMPTVTVSPHGASVGLMGTF